MRTLEFVKRSRLEASSEEVFQWHTCPGAFGRLNLPWSPVVVLQRNGGVRDGDKVTVAIPLGFARLRWSLEHRDYVEGRQFRDVQLKGPFAHWNHLQSIEPDGANSCHLEDRVEYAFPLGFLGRALANRPFSKKLEAAFEYRHNTLSQDLKAHQRYSGMPRFKVAVSGASGLVGSNLTHYLTTANHEVRRLVRREPPEGSADIFWDPYQGQMDIRAMEGLDAVVHLSGESILGRWTPAKKQRLLDSRIRSASLLAETLSKLTHPPKVLVCASAVGYYGDGDDRIFDEANPAGEGFLADLVSRWEAAAEPASKAGIRVVHLRLGPIVTPLGGMLKQMLLPFKMGLGGVLGSGRQYISWISLDDVLGAIEHSMMTESLQGPVNLVAPNPVSNREFTATLGRIIRRPTLLKQPSVVLRAAFGEMANESLLSSTRAEPTKLLHALYDFRHPDLETSLRHVLGRTGATAPGSG